jgi:mannose-6-phosphate isomerase-like protein (cupin superfamily)
LKRLVLAMAIGVALATSASAKVLLIGHGPPQAPADPRVFVTDAEIQHRIAQIEADVKAGRMYSGEPLVLKGPFRATLEWRNIAQDGINEHLDDAEIFVILKGSGELTIGGQLVDPHPARSFPWEGATTQSKSVTGATVYKVAKGDMLLIPPGTPHTVSKVNGELALWSMHMPMDAAHTKSSEKSDWPQWPK